MKLVMSSTLAPTALRVFGGAAVVGPLLLLASTIAYVTEGEAINNGVLGGTIGVWSCFALAIAFVGIYRLLEPIASRAAAIITPIAIIGFAAGVAFNLDAIYIALIPDLTTERLDDAMTGSDAIALLALLPWGWFAPLTFVLTGITLWRSGAAPRWTSVMFIAGGILFISSRPAQIGVLAIISDIALILAMTPIGWAMLTGGKTVVPAIGHTAEHAH